MEYTANAKMMLGYIDDDDDEILDYDGNLDLSTDNEDEDEAESMQEYAQHYPETPEEKINWQEQIRMIHLRSHLNQLLEKVKHAQYVTDKSREELKKCRDQIQNYEAERNSLFREIQTKESDGNQSAVHRVRAAHERICKELQEEQQLERMIMDRLDQAEYDLAVAEVERGKFILAEDDLLQREHQLSKEKTDMAMVRLHKEEQLARQALVTRRKDQKTHHDAVMDAQRRHFQAVEDAEKSHERANKYLQKTLNKLNQRQKEEEERYKTDMTSKMDMLLKLRNDIAHNRENLRAIRARDKAAERKEKSAEQEERERISAKGGNPEEILLVKKRRNEVEKQKQQFETDQKVKKASIMQKILMEEENLKKRKKQQPYLWDCPDREKSLRVSAHTQKPLNALENYLKATADEVAEVEETVMDNKEKEILERLDQAEEEKALAQGGEEGEEGDVAPVEISLPPADEDSDSSLDDETEENVVDLAAPEFEGLWDRETKPYRVPKDNDIMANKPFGGSKMDKEILQKTLERTREGIVVTQVAAGREFSGCPFYSKPDVIHFKDFVVGKTYKKRVTLTNVSYTVNYIKFLDITERLKDFIKIHFDPPGQMSAGLTCEMTVTFKPMINEDLKGEVSFLTQTGPFNIPLVCSTKKCDLTLDTGSVDFGTTVIGETLKRTFTLTNRGALGTKFDFFKVTGMKQRTLTTAGTSLGRMEESQTKNRVSEIERASLKESARSSVQRQAANGQENEPENDSALENVEMGARLEENVKQKSITSLRTTDSMRTVSPEDSMAVPEKPKQAGSNLAVDCRKKSEEALDKIPEAGEVSVPPEPVPEDAEAGEENAADSAPEGSEQKQERESDEATSPDLAVSEMDDYGSLDGMRVGPLITGEIGPFSSLRLEIIWQPTIPGKVDSEFLVTFTDPLSEPLSIHALANAIDVPVWVERQTVDLKICMFDRLYQDTIIVNNRATTALRLKFEVCKELRNHLELLPRTGYIQAQSQFSAQLKFLPRKSLFEEAAKYFDKETGVLEAPMTIRVADQTTPVNFTVQAVLTTSDLEFDVSDIDFGHCTIHESVKKTIKLTNLSILPQQFGFVGLPEYIEVQPNDGFGTLLPLETLELDVIFSPRKTRDYKLELVCRSLINRDFKIQVCGVGVLTPLELSHQVIHFAATPLYDVSSVAFHVVNSHTSSNEFTHPVPRIGKGEICPVGPTSFEFMVPNDVPFTVSPRVGTVMPGEKCRIQVRFSPTLSDYDVRQEALRIHTKLEAAREEKEREEAALREKMEKENKERELAEAQAKKKSKKGNKSRNNVWGNDESDEENEDDGGYDCGADKNMNSVKGKRSTQWGHGLHADEKKENVEDRKRFSGSEKKSVARKASNNGLGVSTTLCGVSSRALRSCEVTPAVEIQYCEPCEMEKERHGRYRAYMRKKINKRRNSHPNGKTRRSKASNEGEEAEERRHFPCGVNKNDFSGRSRNSGSLAKSGWKSASCRSGRTSFFEICLQEEPGAVDANYNKEETTEDKDGGSNVDGTETLPESVPASQGDLVTGQEDGLDQEDFREGGEEDEDEDATAGKGKGKGKDTPKAAGAQAKASKQSANAPSSTGSAMTQSNTPRFDPDTLSRDSVEYQAAITSLVRQYKGQFQSFTVPCCVASGATGNPGELSYSVHNTLYLDVHCPAIKPPVVVISDGGKRTVDFGDVSIGQTCPRSVTIQNISDKDVELSATTTNPHGPFLMLNALRALSPGATHTVLLTFAPAQGQIFQEELGIITLNSTLHLTLRGRGVSPLVNLSIEDELFDMNAVLVSEYVEKIFKIQNTSTLAIDYVIKQDSLSPLRHQKQQEIPAYVTHSQVVKNFVGTQNDNGKNVFDIIPTTGTIQAGETKEITVTFAPDHESDLYSDGVRIELFDQTCVHQGQEESHFFRVIGQAKARVMFLDGGELLTPGQESLAQEVVPADDDDPVPVSVKESETTPQKKNSQGKGVLAMSPPALVTINSVMANDTFQPAVREIYAGCVRTMAVSQKKPGKTNGEFVVEGIQTLLQKGFTVEPQRGMVEAGTKKPIVFTWTPPQGFDPSNTIEETAILTLRCDVTEQIPLMIRAMVVSE
ncbi:cilia- and flagella-associated protein 74 [Aplysia californica]|uniref:Cilia- and flagella-associated protein 74 n=1 Tax=Aplysia californica TaxID=6500 RepID=A0ABM1W164_APLCA|nr:cilia- and flagella-associated protein 74 [Aplysia californica]